MGTYRIAELTVAINRGGGILQRQARPYRLDCTGSTVADITIDVPEHRLKASRAKYPHLTLDEWEYIHTGLVFSQNLLDHDGFCLHASAVALDNGAVLFSAPCGTGKSTHARLWQEYFSDRAIIINDDKPALRLLDGQFYVYGTPWSGKKDLSRNIKVPLKAIVFLEQAPENRLRQLDSKEAVKLLVYQSLRPEHDPGRMVELLALLDALLKRTEIRVFKLGCNISPGAVKMVHEQVYGDRDIQNGGKRR